MEEDRAISAYLRDIAKYKPLSSEEVFNLCVLKDRGDKAAFEKLLKHNLSFVVSVASKYTKKCDLSLLELISAGNIGLSKALEKFDSRYNCTICTYSLPWIKKYIFDEINERNFILRIPVGKRTKISKFRQIIAENVFFDEGLAEMFKDMVSELYLASKPLMLDSLYNESFDGEQNNEKLVDKVFLNLDKDWVNEDEQEHVEFENLNYAIKSLSEREKEFVLMYYWEKLELKEIRDAIKNTLSTERIRQILERSKDKIKNAINYYEKFGIPSNSDDISPWKTKKTNNYKYKYHSNLKMLKIND